MHNRGSGILPGALYPKGLRLEATATFSRNLEEEGKLLTVVGQVSLGDDL